MKVDIEQYELTSKIYLGANLKIIFSSRIDTNDIKVLELSEVVGFIDNINAKTSILTLRIDDEGGSYNFDLALRLKRQEIQKFPEVFLFSDKTCVNLCFRAAAKLIEFRNWTEKDKWLSK